MYNNFGTETESEIGSSGTTTGSHSPVFLTLVLLSEQLKAVQVHPSIGSQRPFVHSLWNRWRDRRRCHRKIWVCRYTWWMNHWYKQSYHYKQWGMNASWYNMQESRVHAPQSSQSIGVFLASSGDKARICCAGIRIIARYWSVDTSAFRWKQESAVHSLSSSILAILLPDVRPGFNCISSVVGT